jgi:hypothetical protein
MSHCQVQLEDEAGLVEVATTSSHFVQRSLKLVKLMSSAVFCVVLIAFIPLWLA